ncbi:MAG: DUF1080 domain-containing protein [Deltaproteobacteria bacterium]|nr:DUF1080 domain-containing protein [Deltaproteobacteria bacterium]
MRTTLILISCAFALMLGSTFFASAGTITNNFGDGIDDWTVFSGVWTVQDGVLHQDEMGGPKVIVWDAPGELTDFTISVKARALTADADWGLAFHATDAQNHYSWQWVNGHLAFVSYVANSRSEDWTQDQPMEMNTWQEFTVIAEGASYTLYWKGDEITTFEHDALTTGKVGFFTWDQVDFDDFAVTAAEVGTAVSLKGKLTTTWGSIKAK